jgi:hypothetical protein
MSNCLENRPPVPFHPRRFQFSLRSLLIVSLLFAIFSAGIFNNYNIVRYLSLLAHETVSFYIFLVWAIYARGYLRTFGIGATLSYLFPWVITLFYWFYMAIASIDQSSTQTQTIVNMFTTKSYTDGFEYFWPSIAALMLIVDAILAGGSMVLARWLIDRSRRQMEKAAVEGSSVVQESPAKPQAAEGSI